MMANSRITNLVQRYDQNRTQESGPNAVRGTIPSTPSQDASTRPKPRSSTTNFGRDRFEQRITQARTVDPSTTRRYPSNLTPTPSPLRPMCPAKDRLLLWKPTEHTHRSNGADPPLPPTDEERIREVLVEAYSDSTKTTYGTGLLVFHVFCDRKGIDETQRTPCGQTLLSNFISTLISDYSAQAIENYTYGLRARHIVHRISWNVNNVELQALFASAAKNQPPKSAKAQRPPCTIEDLVAIRENLNPRDPFDATVFACLTTAFWSVARLGELTVPNSHWSRSGRSYAKPPEYQPIQRRLPSLPTSLERDFPTNVEEYFPHSNPKSPHGCEKETHRRTLPQNKRHLRVSTQRNRLPGRAVQRKMGERNGIRRIPAQTRADPSPVHASEPRTAESFHPTDHAPRSLRRRESFSPITRSARLVFGTRSPARRVAGTPNLWESQLTFFQCHSLCRKPLRVFTQTFFATRYGLLSLSPKLIIFPCKTDAKNKDEVRQIQPYSTPQLNFGCLS